LAPQNEEKHATPPLHSQRPSFPAPCAFSRNLPDDKLDQVRDEIGDIPIYLPTFQRSSALILFRRRMTKSRKIR